MARTYAQVVGVVVLLLAVLGFIAGDQLFGAINIELAEDVIHLASGGLLAYAGFALKDNAAVRKIVLTVGVIYLLVGILGFVIPKLLGLLEEGYTAVDNIIHLALGVAGIFASRDTRDTATARHA